MSTISLNVALPLDSEGFLRRECPLCHRQFKVDIPEADRKSLVERTLEEYLLREGLELTAEVADATTTEEIEVWCPYCSQSTTLDRWWTQEQLAYIRVYGYNVMAQIVNEQLIRPMKRELSGRRHGLLSIEFRANEMKYQEPWISPETDDMIGYLLPCCSQRIKLDDNWSGPITCCSCGITHLTLAETRS